MSSNSSAKRCTKRSSRDLNRAKMNLNVDLNSPPAEVAPAQSSQPPPPSVPPHAAAAEGSGGVAVEALIDLEASDDELQLLSSPRGFHQARNQPRRRNRPVIVVVDEEREIHTGTSGVRIEGLVTMSGINCTGKRQRIPPNRTVINCESYTSHGDQITKRMKSSKVVPEKVVPPPPKEPTFSCPICMGALVSPCSTVCGHIFCEGCIKTAVQMKKICPTCRTKLTMKNYFHKVFLPTTATD